MYRTVNNGELRIKHIGQEVIMCGWVQKSRDLGGMTFIDLLFIGLLKIDLKAWING